MLIFIPLLPKVLLVFAVEVRASLNLSQRYFYFFSLFVKKFRVKFAEESRPLPTPAREFIFRGGERWAGLAAWW